MKITAVYLPSFNPLPSHEGRRFFRSGRKQSDDLSIHFPLTREDQQNDFLIFIRCLSIHFPLTREDHLKRLWFNDRSLSIHFPLTREDICSSGRRNTTGSFQSTSLSRGKTITLKGGLGGSSFQSTSLSRGKTRVA